MLAALALIAFLVVLSWYWWVRAPGLPEPIPFGRRPAVEPIPNLLYVLTYPDHEALIGNRVQFGRETVREVVEGRGFWIGAAQIGNLFVAPVAGQMPEDLRPGNVVAIRGSLERVPPAEEARALWGDTLAAALREHTLYVRADTVVVR